jgi:citrate/tricarballylate utilization protein
MPLADLLKEGERVMIICNACRYCEGHCAVFPAMEQRTEFPPQDLHYLANLCHDCGSCYHHCQYAPPHEFAVNVPKTFKEIREETYRKYAWPKALAGLFEGNAVSTAAIVISSLCLLGMIAFSLSPEGAMASPHEGPGAFYEIISHDAMIALFGIVWLLVLAACTAGFLGFWRESGPRRKVSARHFGIATLDVLKLRYLDGGAGDGCTYPTEAPSQARRVFHHFTYYGFLLCLASTTVAALYDNFLGRKAPYPVASAPVLLGIAGGIGLLVGPTGLLALKLRSDEGPNPRSRFVLDVTFLALLFLTTATGFLLLLFRSTAAMGTLLWVHLGFVLGLFATLPYGKFVHAVYRFAALLRYAVEKPAS